MYLFRLMYVSTAIERFTPESLEELAQTSARANLVRGVTGVLLFAGGHFLQVIEGRRSEIDRLYRNITADPRHACIERVQYGAIARRMFPEWAMALRNLDDDGGAGPREFRVIRDFLDQCGGIDVDDETRAMLGFFQSRVAERV